MTIFKKGNREPGMGNGGRGMGNKVNHFPQNFA